MFLWLLQWPPETIQVQLLKQIQACYLVNWHESMPQGYDTFPLSPFLKLTLAMSQAFVLQANEAKSGAQGQAAKK